MPIGGYRTLLSMPSYTYLNKPKIMLGGLF